MSEQKKNMRTTVIIRVVACLVILLVGFGGFKFLKGRKKAPSHAVQTERPLQVQTVVAAFKEVPVVIEAHG